MLTIEDLNQYYGESHTLWDVGLAVPEGAVIGAYLDEIRSLRQEENAGA